MDIYTPIQDEKRRQLEELELLVEKRAKSQSHFENYKEHISEEQKEHLEDLQATRTIEIENIKDKLASNAKAFNNPGHTSEIEK